MTTAGSAQERNLIPSMDEQMRASFARKLRPARLDQGMTQQQVAAAAGIARNTYAAMESGKQIPQADKLWAAMLVLGIRPEAPDSPEWLREWWRIIEPLALRVPVSTRGIVMGEIVRILHDAITGSGD